LARRLSDVFEDNLVPFPRGQFEKRQNEREAAFDEEPVRIERGVRTCNHDRSTVNEQARTLTCRDCGVALDPIYVLSRLALNREHLISRGRRLRDEVDHLQERADDLKRQEKNTKARLRNAQHPALKDARQALSEAQKVLLEAERKLAFDPPLQERVRTTWGKCSRAYDALRPSRVA
jgi:chromosome segregation ATPase